MNATIKDVAKLASVSAATVSLVIHGNNRISAETKMRVQSAIQELNYHPTRSARGLVSKTSGNIGFILTEDHFSRSEPFYTKIFLGTEFQSRKSAYYILLTTIPSDYQNESSLPRFVLEKNVDGVILAGKVPTALIEKIKKYNLPMVFVDYYPSEGDFPCVMIDNLHAGVKVVEYLSGIGHEKIAFIAGDLSHPSIMERYHGYKMGLELRGHKVNPQLVVTEMQSPDRSGGYLAMKKLVARDTGFTALFCCNDAMAIGALQYAKEKKIRVPEDVSIMGFDDVDANLSLDPPLSTISVPKIDMGVEALNLMVNELQNRSNGVKKILVPTSLIVRKSTVPL